MLRFLLAPVIAGGVVLAGLAGQDAPTVVATPPADSGGTMPTTALPPTTAPPATTPTTAPTTRPTTPPTTAPPAPSVLRPGSRGPEVLALQRRLTELRYWLGSADGSYGLLTHQAVYAFQKAHRLPRTGVVDAATHAALDAPTAVTPRRITGDGIEIDKVRQLLLVVRDGRVAWVVNTSTGTEKPYRNGETWAEADTPEGTWRIDRAVDGVRRAALGNLYRPRYFHRDGIAIHGSPSVPPHPASHGCARVTNAAMDWIWREDVAPIGSTVVVY